MLTDIWDSLTCFSALHFVFAGLSLAGAAVVFAFAIVKTKHKDLLRGLAAFLALGSLALHWSVYLRDLQDFGMASLTFELFRESLAVSVGMLMGAGVLASYDSHPKAMLFPGIIGLIASGGFLLAFVLCFQ